MSILVKNAVVVTMDAKETIIPNGGVVVKDNLIGTVYAGTAPQKDENYDDVIDAQNHVLMPGFVNLHTHSVTNALRGGSRRIWGDHARHEDLLAFCGGLTPAESYAFARLFICELIRSGCTTFADSSDFVDSVAEAALDTGIRCFLAGGKIYDQEFWALPRAAEQKEFALGQKTLKQALIFLDKWEHKNERVQGMLYPYSVSSCSPALWREIAALTEQVNVGISTHLAQSALEVERVQALHQKTCVSYLADCGILNERFIGADGVFLTEEDCQILAARRANIAHNALANALYGQMAPLCQMMQSGINVGLGTDSLSGDMVKVLRHALTSWRMREHVPEEPQPEEIYRLSTVGGAKALGQADRLGSIEAGKLADLLIVDFNEPNVRPLFEQKYVQQLTHSGMASNVLTVLIDGHVIMQDRVMKAFREEEVLAEAQKAAATLRQRMK